MAGDVQAGAAKACGVPDLPSSRETLARLVFPSLAGQASYRYSQLREFDTGARTNPVMASVAHSLSDAEMRDLAAYFAARLSAVATAPAQAVARGRALYQAGDARRGILAVSGLSRCRWPRSST